MELIMNQEYHNETIIFDGFHFVGCSFVNCTIIVTSPDFDFDRCSFIGSHFHVDPELSVFEQPQQSLPLHSDSGLFHASGDNA
jgi:hypothetical protein